MAVHTTTSRSGISSNRVRASLVRPLSKYDLMMLVAKMEGRLGWKGGLGCWVVQFWVHWREFLIVGGI